MRTLLLFGFFIVFASPGLTAQNCESAPSAQIDLAVNGVRARLTTGGDLWWDGQDGGYMVTADAGSPNVNPVSAIFAGSLWIGGMDPGGGLKIAAQQYGRAGGRYDYFPGPLTQEGVAFGECEAWDKFFVIKKEEINDYLTNFDPANPQDYQLPANIAGWPATGNPLFTGIHGFDLPSDIHPLAPFWDEDLDGIYDPRNGDYPLFCGDEAIWCVFNDASNNHGDSGTTPIQAEVQLMAYAYASNDEELHRTTFYDYKIFNRSLETLTDFYAGNWIDSDLGCFTDDLIGSDPEHNLFYVYNQNGLDRDPCVGGVASYGETAPVNIFQVVNTSLDAEPGTEDPLMHSVANIFNSGVGSPTPGTTDPNTALEYYNYMMGRWSDGQPITRGGNGYNAEGETTLFAFDGGPVGNSTWQHCTSDIGNADIRQVYSTGPYNLQPGQSAEFTLAITTIFGVDYPDGNCPTPDVIIAAAEKIKSIYDSNCTISALTSVDQPVSPEAIGLVTFPNPTSGEITFRLPEEHQIDQIEILDITGRLQSSLRAGSNSHTFDLQLPTGTYIYRLTTSEGEVVAGRVVVIK